MKNLKRKITVLSIALLCCICFMPKAFAMETANLFVSTGDNYNIIVAWDTEKPDIILISPKGDEIDVFSYTDNLFLGDKVAIYYLVNADSGQWQVSCDKKTNDAVNISYTKQSEAIWIEEFTMSEIVDNTAQVFFKVDKEVSYYYEISAILEDDTSVKKVLKSGSSSLLEMDLSISLNDLNSYSGYKLMLTVGLNNTDLIIEDAALTDAFDFINENEDAAPLLEKLGITVNLSTNVVSFNTYTNYKRYQFLLRYSSNVITESTQIFTEYTSFAFDYKTEQIYFGIRIEDANKYSSELFKEIDLASSVSFDWDYSHDTVINTSTISMNVNNAIGYNAVAVINNESQEFVIESGVLNFTLEDGQNTIEITVTDSEGIDWVLSENVFVDTTAPSFRMFQDYNNQTVGTESIIMVGEVEKGTVLMVNDEEVEVDAVGGFSVEVFLVEGENVFSFVASDAVGNKTSYSPTIIYEVGYTAKGEGSDWFNYLVLASAAFIAMIISGIAIVMFRKKGNKEGE